MPLTPLPSPVPGLGIPPLADPSIPGYSEEVQAGRPWTVYTFAPIAGASCVTVVGRWSTSARGAIAGTDTAPVAAVVEFGGGVCTRPGSATSGAVAGVSCTPGDRRLTAVASGLLNRK